MPDTIEALIAEARDGCFEDRAWMIDVIDRLADALSAAHTVIEEAKTEFMKPYANLTQPTSRMTAVWDILRSYRISEQEEA